MNGSFHPIRSAEKHDAGALTKLALRSKAHWGYDADFMAACEGELTVAPEQIGAELSGVGQHDGEIAGFYLLTRGSRGNCSVLEFFFVDPRHIGTGLGTALWDHMIHAARLEGLGKIRIDADPNAEGFYHRMGAVKAGSAPSDSVSGRYLPVMEFVP